LSTVDSGLQARTGCWSRWIRWNHMLHR